MHLRPLPSWGILALGTPACQPTRSKQRSVHLLREQCLSTIFNL
jgi:hypothetical protein